ncbi:MAG TPA: asparagine synthase (glutamine-hydrolyzing) [Pyrinomonadaceae bacterium]|nr:asparagine synthase (glutamine-hydrolyzing) [Pyrinomonadaceae bacterium]
MCGISGIVTREKLSAGLSAAVSRMNAAQIHRGPDGAGEFSAPHVKLMMRRLSVIDLEGGAQPLYNEDESLALIFNGEIYNYRELRDRLKKSGHAFRTETDGEVILHLYEENDSDFVTRLRGMFAFALWDGRRRRLVLARDRMGEKPLYLFERDGALVFASELKGLLHSGLVPFRLNPRAVNLYFHYQYVPEPLTPIEGARKLDAAHLLTVDVENWRIEEKKYWRMEDAPPLDGEPRELIREKLEEVSRLIVRSDVPVGVALSGGLDSSIVAAFAAREHDNLRAFSVGYAGRPDCDERADAAALARRLNLPLDEIELDTQEIVDFFPELNYWRDDPVADIAGFGYYFVMQLARERGVPVLLQGQGGDELFWGYPQLREAAFESMKKAALLDKPFSQAVRQTLNFNFPASRSARGVSSWARDFAGMRSGWRNVRRRRENPAQMIFYDLSPDFASAAAQVRNFYGRSFAGQVDEADAAEIFTFPGGWSPVEIALTKLICDTYLRENGITQGDRLGMASSVEMRLPLVDYKFVETVIGLRKRHSDSSLPPKFRLREAVKDVLPEWVLNRPKRGFAPPARQWHDALFAAYGESLRDGYLVQSEVLNRESAARLAEGEFPSNATSPLSFKALVLEQWCRRMRRIIPAI